MISGFHWENHQRRGGQSGYTCVGEPCIFSLQAHDPFSDGGFLQWGSTTSSDLSTLLSETSIRAVIVLPAYRLNLFGFLASSELLSDAQENDLGTVGNLGFWDQRLALEWIHANIADFGGNKDNITLGGLSAGAHSTFHQLSYELRLPDSEAFIKRVVMYSNGTAFQPKTVAENQGLFDALLKALGIPLFISGSEKVSRLRSLPFKVLVSATEKMVQNQFRATTDGSFVKETLFSDLRSGKYAETMVRRGIKILLGDVKDEGTAYKQEYPPSSYDSMKLRLGADYTSAAVDALATIYLPDKALPRGQSWQDVFGQVYADVQVYVTQRGFISELAKHLPKDSIFRYKIEWRAQCVDLLYPPEMGVTHASDMPIWFFGNGWPGDLGLEENEKTMIQEWLGPFWRFLKGKEGDLGWGTKDLEDVRCIRGDMTIGVKRDGDWERGLEVWEKLKVVDEVASRL